jgi:fructose-bisphosphate aldolase class II
MPLILERLQVLEIYAEAEERGWVLPTFNAENLTTTEAILSAAMHYGDKIGVDNLPIIIGITNTYRSRPQSVYYTHTRQWNIGMQLFLRELEVLTSENSPFYRLRVMVHLDHIQWDDDLDLLSWDLGQFSSIMYDASTLPLDMNIKKTTEFREKHSDKILIEGACDVIGMTSDHDEGLTKPEDAKQYLHKTGVDIIVANLGTEHRASSAELHYRSDLAKEITRQLGKGCLCLHGTSSVSGDSLGTLFNDGIRKVNIWTALERDSSKVLLQKMIEHASKIVGQKEVERLLGRGLLGKSVDRTGSASVDYFTTTYRQSIVHAEMKKSVEQYLHTFYKV